MTRAVVRDLVSRGVLRVEDGNHGNDRPRPDEFVQSGVAFIRAADMTSGVVDFKGAGKINAMARHRIRKGVGAPGDVILSHKGTVGRVAVAPLDSPDYVCSPQTTFWRSLDYDVLDQGYLKYVLHSSDFQRQLAMLGGQTDMAPYVSLTDQRSMEFELIPIGKQRAIAEVLGALDAKIAANQEASRQAIELISALHLWALQGDDVRERPLFDVIDIDFGEAFKGEHFVDRGVGRPLIRIRDLKTFAPQTWTTEARPREVVVQPGDVAVGMDAEFRATWWLGEPGLLNQRVCRARGKSLGPAFVASALRRPLAALEGEKSATTVIHLNKSDLSRSAVSVPTSRLADFEGRAEPLLAQHVSLSAESAKLRAARDELLPLLMSGRVQVMETEKIAEERL